MYGSWTIKYMYVWFMNYKVHVCNDKQVYSTNEGNRENVYFVPEE